MQTGGAGIQLKNLSLYHKAVEEEHKADKEQPSKHYSLFSHRDPKGTAVNINNDVH